MPDYSLEGAKWSQPIVTWSFAETTYASDQSSPFSSSIPSPYEDSVRWAFQQWALVAPLSFEGLPDSPSNSTAADIRLGFAALNTPSTGIVGQTTITWINATNTLVPDEIVRLEDPSQLALMPNGDGNYTYAGTTATIRQVALHEIGHALGLGHATDPNAVMYASVGANNQTLNATDIAGIQSLYGSPVIASLSPSSANTDILVVHLSEDAWQGDVQFLISVDGQQLGAPQEVTALHALGQDQTFTFQGNFGRGPHDVGISFLNDAWGGTSDTDRNLYIDSLNFNGASVPQSSTALLSAGTAHFQVGQDSAPTPPTAPDLTDVLLVHLSEDAWQGDAQFLVSVDGQQLGAPQEVTALHALGQDQTFTFQGKFGLDPHDVGISFLNDAWGGAPDTDRNLYVDSLSFDGAPVSQSLATLFSAGTAHFQVGQAGGYARTGSDVDSAITGSAFPLT